MPAQRIDPVNCWVARALSVVGERWSLLIAREALNGVRRFGKSRSRPGIAGKRHRPRGGEDCGEPVRAILECTAGHTHLSPRTVYRAPGPGVRFPDSA